MAVVDLELLSKSATGFTDLPVSKQAGMIVSLAATIALGVSIAFWARDPHFRPVYSGLSPKEAGEVIDNLQQLDIKFKYDESYGAILVPAKIVADARIKLASKGLPKGDGFGFEILGTQRSFGDSQFLETARYRQALSGELARTISGFKQVRSARVHLAIPKQSAFIRDKKKPSASVFLDIYSGSLLDQDAVDAIVHLVASSIPGLNGESVTVVDDRGRLLTNNAKDPNVAMTEKFLKYRYQLEQNYSNKIQDILLPILGQDKIKARVTADIDYTVVEQTQEKYNPDMPALRSESMLYEKHGKNGERGAPGSIANEPPAASRIESGDVLNNVASSSGSQDAVRQSTRNFEVDKTISHTQYHPGQIKRLTVAVVIDDRVSVSKSGKRSQIPYEPDEIEQIKNIVKNAIGFNIDRGDSVEIINKRFAPPPVVEEFPPEPIWKQGWFWDLVKHIVGAIFILLIILGVLRPVMKTLAERIKNDDEEFEEEIIDDSSSVEAEYHDPMKLPDNLQTPESRMQVAHELASDDPKRVSQVVKKWVENGGA